ncbi:MAG: hypothetical protein ABSA62_08815 [Methyloceanibacter sp.]|jgi:hypothetical protein
MVHFCLLVLGPDLCDVLVVIIRDGIVEVVSGFLNFILIVSE